MKTPGIGFSGFLIIKVFLAGVRVFREMCIRFAELERKLGEIDRARAIYAHCSQICDPRVNDSSLFEFFHSYINSYLTIGDGEILGHVERF